MNQLKEVQVVSLVVKLKEKEKSFLKFIITLLNTSTHGNNTLFFFLSIDLYCHYERLEREREREREKEKKV
jgi:hypothetical protein